MAAANIEQPGARPIGGDRCRFRLWAPRARQVTLHLLAPHDRRVPMRAGEHGAFEVELGGVGPGARYLYQLDHGPERPDPASHLQPEGVHGPSEVVDPSFHWTDDDWRGLPLAHYAFYELHVGSFTPEGSFAGVERQLARLVRLGITAVELMPVAQFPGDRNWGYDGVYPFAVQQSYGGPQGLKQLVDACHRHGLALVLDVVYNHLGPEGCYLREFGPYFTDRYRSPWGEALNFDGAGSDEVRAFFIANALRWVEEFHVDALRLDALHAIFDFSARPFVLQLQQEVRGLAERLGRQVHLIAESDLNDARLIRSEARGGLGLDAQWSDDWHHALHALLTGERAGYYQDFGTLDHLLRAARDGYTYRGERSAFRGRRHGNDPRGAPPERFVVCSQNHDQVGNRMRGERLLSLTDLERAKLAAAAVVLSPYLPLLFMGQEQGARAPFLYFVSHGDRELVQAVREGRRREFAAFHDDGELLDPQDAATFERCRLDLDRPLSAEQRTLRRLYETLFRLRWQLPALQQPSRERMALSVADGARALVLRRWHDGQQTCLVLHFGCCAARGRVALPAGRWRRVLDTAHCKWDGPGSQLPRVVQQPEGEAAAALPLSPHAALLLCRGEA